MCFSLLALIRSSPCNLAQEANDSKGSTLIEFAIIIPVFMLLLGALIDFSINLIDYSYLSHEISRVTRDASSLPGAQSCQSVVSKATSELHTVFSEMQFTASVKDDLGGINKLLQVNTTWLPRCFFCQLVSGQMSIPVSSMAVMETNCV